jgi:4-diphosphocytidyl-2-C-methyl-D-erythritol kinase
VIPDFGVNTAQAYGALAAARVASGSAPPFPTYSEAGWDGWAEVSQRQMNDFEPTVFAAHPELAVVRRQLADAGALVARLSGSGSALFGIWPVATTPPDVPLPDHWTSVRTATN